MRPADIVVFATYFGLVFLIGLAASRKRGSREDFLLAGRSMRWFPIGTSIMATVFSAVNFTGFSGEVLQHGLYVLMAVPAFLLVTPLVLRFVIPFFHDKRPVSAYAYLEDRFDARVRRLASALFLGWRLVWMALILHATARLLQAGTGIPGPFLILLSGSIATTYTTIGGMRAVMWTDVFQSIVLLGGLAVALGAALHALGGVQQVFAQAAASGHLRPFVPFDPAVLSFDPRVRISLWSAIIGSLVAFLARYGADQMVVQRYFTAKSLLDAKRGFHLNIALSLVAILILGLLGLCAWTPIPRDLSSPATVMQALAAFMSGLPAGAMGLLLAGLMATTMSSLDSGLHACVTSMTSDWRPPGAVADVSPAHDRLLTVFFGALAMAGGCWIGRLGTVFEIANKVINGLGSPLLALFLLARYCPAANASGVLIGGILGTGASIAVSGFVHGLALHYYAVVNLVLTLVFGYVASLAITARQTAGNPRTAGSPR